MKTRNESTLKIVKNEFKEAKKLVKGSDRRTARNLAKMYFEAKQYEKYITLIKLYIFDIENSTYSKTIDDILFGLDALVYTDKFNPLNLNILINHALSKVRYETPDNINKLLYVMGYTEIKDFKAVFLSDKKPYRLYETDNTIYY